MIEHQTFIVLFIGLIDGLFIGYYIGSCMRDEYFKKELEKIIDNFESK